MDIPNITSTIAQRSAPVFKLHSLIGDPFLQLVAELCGPRDAPDYYAQLTAMRRISRKIRKTIDSFPGFWTCITPALRHPQFRAIVLNRSAGWPLAIKADFVNASMDEDALSSWVADVIAASGRWQKLHLSTPTFRHPLAERLLSTPAPILTHFSCARNDIVERERVYSSLFDGNAPNLASLVLPCLGMTSLLDDFNLSELDFGSLPRQEVPKFYDQLEDIINALKGLKYLKLTESLVRDLRYDVSEAINVIELPEKCSLSTEPMDPVLLLFILRAVEVPSGSLHIKSLPGATADLLHLAAHFGNRLTKCTEVLIIGFTFYFVDRSQSEGVTSSFRICERVTAQVYRQVCQALFNSMPQIVQYNIRILGIQDPLGDFCQPSSPSTTIGNRFVENVLQAINQRCPNVWRLSILNFPSRMIHFNPVPFSGGGLLPRLQFLSVDVADAGSVNTLVASIRNRALNYQTARMKKLLVAGPLPASLGDDWKIGLSLAVPSLVALDMSKDHHIVHEKPAK